MGHYSLLLMKKPPWLSRDIAKLIKDKRKAWNTYNKDKTSDIKWETYTRSRNLTSKEIIKAKTYYEDKIANDSKKNTKTVLETCQFKNKN